jgi:anti-sigma B factor antagonist
MQSPVRYVRGRVHVEGEMTVYTCSDLKARLFAELTDHRKASELDLSGVVEFDTAGLQLLLAARRYAGDSGRDLRVTNPSRSVLDVLELCRLHTCLAAESSPR